MHHIPVYILTPICSFSHSQIYFCNYNLNSSVTGQQKNCMLNFDKILPFVSVIDQLHKNVMSNIMYIKGLGSPPRLCSI